ncbi:MAG: EAL domain-containing protein [Alphaproteobacteria bacterium]|nr:EAL domain-containing protein [Alphaproteobacteria bacterium]
MTHGLAPAAEPATTLRNERDRFAVFALTAADAFLETDRDLNIRFATGATHWLLGRDEAVVKSKNMLDFVAEDYKRLVKAACKGAIRDGRFGPIPIGFQQPDGRVVHVDVSSTYLPNRGGEFYIAARAHPLGLAMQKPNSQDGTTPSKRPEPHAVAQSIAKAAQAASENGQDLSLTLFNLDGLESLQSRLAPTAAGELMADIEAHLQAFSAGDAGVTQVGDEEFGLLHRGGIDIQGLEQDIDDCASAFDPKGEGVSIRSSTLAVSGVDLSEADMAKAVVYVINKFTETRGEFTVRDLSDGYKGMLQDTSIRIAGLKTLIRQRAFDLHYQPIIALDGCELHHYEALVRFRADDETASPYATIAFAEEVGLIAALDLAICHKAISTILSARREGLQLSLAVNVSGRSLETPVFLDRLRSLLRECQSFPQFLLFEVTESSKIKNLEATNNFLKSLRNLGHRVCIDDFGAGASAFQYLRALAVDYVKIDGSYVREITSNRDARSFVRSMASLCHELGMQTIAEMIEDRATVDELLRMGIAYGQGYLFGKPLPEFRKVKLVG